ncbi:hypothetical protein P171DRAFT_338906, partial [Karstenula rhodostoma CBS 690.94]
FFMATVPAGTQLYHGTPSEEVVKGMEWLAFEPEHALVFARPRGGRPGRGPGHGNREEEDGPSSPPPPHDNLQRPFPNHPPHPPPTTAKGYLHTYIPTRPLRLLYIDGLSAAKTSNGTLDTQDVLLLDDTVPHDSPMGGDIARARALCDLASTPWESKIDGILRMEAGFEIILCDFGSTVVRESVVAYDGPPGVGKGRVFGGWRYIQAVSGRYHGIGGGRVTLDYEDFVSVFAYDGEEGGMGMGLWDNDVASDTPQPRLVKASPEQLGKIRDAVTAMVLGGGGVGEGRDWQAVADMVVTRYGKAIHYLHADASVRSSNEAFAKYLSALLRPFVSPSARNASLETERCVAQIVPPLPLPPSSSPPLAHTTLHTVTTHICSTLLNALDASTLTLSRPVAATSSPPYRALDLVDGLVGYLQWTAWKECGSCADEEVCFVPIWPMGSLENHRNPQCVTEDGVGGGYWG